MTKDSDIKVEAIARVQLTIEMTVSAWGGECSIGQLYSQAKDDAEKKVASTLSGITGIRLLPNLTKVTGILTERQ